MSNKIPTQEQSSLQTKLENSKAPGYLKGVVVGSVAAIALYGVAEHYMGTDSTPDKGSAPVCVPFGEQDLLVARGNGTQDIANMIDGSTDGDPANDPCNPAKKAIIEDAQHSDMLQPGEILHLPIGVYPQGEVPEGSVMYTVDPK